MSYAKFYSEEYSSSLDSETSAGVKITPNCKSIRNQFPVLGFTVKTGGLPFFEVLLTTDRELFAPANAGRRQPSNFYASRQDSGLIRAAETESVYLVPPAVLRTFAQAQQRPSAVYYALVAYQSAEGTGPVFSQSPERLQQEAPSVSIMENFTGQTLATVLGVPVAQLKPVAAFGGTHQTHEASAWSPVESMTADTLLDAGEGEDGYGRAQSSLESGDDGGLAEEYGEDTGETEHEGFVYRDGYESEHGPIDTSARAQESTFPEGAPEPEPLSDDDDPYAEDLSEETGEDLGVTELSADDEYPNGENREADEVAYSSAYTDTDDADGGNSSNDDTSHDGYTSYASETAVVAGEPEFGALDQPADIPPTPLTIDDRKRIVQRVGRFESARDGYTAVNPDGEFEGRLGTNHPAYQRYHIGLSYGLIQFSQDSGLLGRLLAMMRDRDPQAFGEVFGGDPPVLEQLIAITNAAGPSSRKVPGGRSARVQPVAGLDLWREPWLSRFRRAGEHVAFQAAQNQLASEVFVDSMLRFAGSLALNTDRALTMVVDRAVGLGPDSAKRWIISAVGPVSTDSLKQQALAAIGASDVSAFQRGTPGLAVDGHFGADTHAAMVAALRALGSRSPIPIPTRDQMLDQMVRHAAGTPWERRITHLRSAKDFRDTPYQL